MDEQYLQIYFLFIFEVLWCWNQLLNMKTHKIEALKTKAYFICQR